MNPLDAAPAVVPFAHLETVGRSLALLFVASIGGMAAQPMLMRLFAAFATVSQRG